MLFVFIKHSLAARKKDSEGQWKEESLNNMYRGLKKDDMKLNLDLLTYYYTSI